MRCIRILLVLVLLAATSWVQAATPLDSSDIPPRLNYGFSKNTNTFLFEGGGRGSIVGILGSDLGKLAFDFNYRGRIIRGSNTSIRDDANGLAEFSLPLADNLDFISGFSGLLSDDSRSLGINKLLQGSARSGLRWTASSQLRSEASLGGVYSEQLGIASRGFELASRSTLRDFDLDDYILNADANVFHSELSNRQSNTIGDASFNLQRFFAGNSWIDFNATYKTSSRDFYTFVRAQDTVNNLEFDTIALETRGENRWRVDGRLYFPVVPQFDVALQTSLENTIIDRFYARSVSGADNTQVTRSLERLHVFLDFKGIYTGAGGSHALGIWFDQRDESNVISNRFDLDDAQIGSLRQTENQRDNSAARTGLSLESLWPLSSADSLRFSVASSLLRYDTPSADNNDDRDEFNLNATLAFARRFSHVFYGELTAELKFAHLVFLRAARSSQNNWNRIFRLEPRFVIDAGSFSARPSFEVLANFTSFDFENRIVTSPSFSFRQISYRDSLSWQVGRHHRLESQLIARYFERGQFRWSNFTETPQDENYEHFCRLLAFSSSSGIVEVGIGGRYYALYQKKLRQIAGVDDEFLRQSIAPESVVRLAFGSGSSLEIQGWFEFEFTDGREQRRFPNLFLTTQVNL